jgi:hypothetical protein
VSLRALAGRIADWFALGWDHLRGLLARLSLMSEDFNFITPRLATGGAIVDERFVHALINAGVTHVIDCTDAENDSELMRRHPTLKYLHNPTADDGKHKPPSWFAASLRFALPAFAEPHAKVYAHCTSGHNRGPSTAYCIMRALGWDAATALALVKAKRPGATVAYAADADAAIAALGYE